MEKRMMAARLGISTSNLTHLIDRFDRFCNLWSEVYYFILFERNQIIASNDPGVELWPALESRPGIEIDEYAIELGDLCQELRSNYFGPKAMPDIPLFVMNGKIVDPKTYAPSLISRCIKLKDCMLLDVSIHNCLSCNKNLSSDLRYLLKTEVQFLRENPNTQIRWRQEYIEPAKRWAELILDDFAGKREQLEEDVNNSIDVGENFSTFQLNDNEATILLSLNDLSGRLVDQNSISDKSRLSIPTVRKSLNRLRELGLSHRPNGEKSGEGITAEGKRWLQDN